MVKTFNIIGNNSSVASINFAASAEGDLLKEPTFFETELFLPLQDKNNKKIKINHKKKTDWLAPHNQTNAQGLIIETFRF